MLHGNIADCGFTRRPSEHTLLGWPHVPDMDVRLVLRGARVCRRVYKDTDETDGIDRFNT